MGGNEFMPSGNENEDDWDDEDLETPDPVEFAEEMLRHPSTGKNFYIPHPPEEPETEGEDAHD